MLVVTVEQREPLRLSVKGDPDEVVSMLDCVRNVYDERSLDGCEVWERLLKDAQMLQESAVRYARPEWPENVAVLS